MSLRELGVSESERGFYRAEIAVVSYNPGSKGNGFRTRPVCRITCVIDLSLKEILVSQKGEH